MQNVQDYKFKHRSPVGVFFMPFITFGLYPLYWAAETKGNINRLGGDIPTAWLLWVPVINLWWLWRYAQGAEQVTKGSLSAITVFILMIVSVIGVPILQSKYNEFV